MKAQEFEQLEQAFRDDEPAIVARILVQSRESGPLAPWEERFLQDRAATLRFPELVSWLAHRPADPSLVVGAIARLAPGPSSLAGWHLVEHAEAIGAEAWAVLRARLPAALGLPIWESAILRARERVAEARARRPEDANEHAGPIAWLSTHGVPRGELVALALAGLESPEASDATYAEIVRWLGEQLVTRSAWETHGEAVLQRLLARWGPFLLGWLTQLLDHAVRSTRVLSDEQAPADLTRGLLSLGPPPPWTPALHESLARLILRMARESLERGRLDEARSALAALAHLTPPAHIIRLVHSLRDLPALDARTRELIDLNLRLLRREDGQAASLEGVLNAFRQLAG